MVHSMVHSMVHTMVHNILHNTLHNTVTTASRRTEAGERPVSEKESIGGVRAMVASTCSRA